LQRTLGHAQHPIIWTARILLIDQAHQVQILLAGIYRLVVQACSVHPEQLALLPHTALLVVLFDPLLKVLKITGCQEIRTVPHVLLAFQQYDPKWSAHGGKH
jgi:hypothetical protein